jgi:ectoine hydroxylase-related dioxygenase (phytanoyl-CoA dioxygenase family)
MEQINKENRNIFFKNGFLTIDNIVDVKLLRKVEKNYKKIFSGAYSTGVVPDKIKWKQNRDPNNIPRSLCNVWKSNVDVAKIVLLKEISKIAGKLMGWESTRLNQDSLIWVTPGSGCVNYHQDNPYQDWHTPGGVITCWIPLSDTTSDSATLEFLAGSNKLKMSKRLENFYAKKNYRYINKNFFNKRNNFKIEPLVLKEGSVSFHHGKTWHGSGFNKTKKDRVALSIHFMNGKSKFHKKIKSPYFNHYKKFDSTTMEESFFPITWSENSYRSLFIKKYLKNK